METKNLNLFIFILFAFTAEAQTKSVNNSSIIHSFDIEKIPIGDLNNDKIIDTAFVQGPKYLNQEDGWGDCTDGHCKITVSFSSKYPSATVDNAVSGFVENIGDIDHDGIAEIMIVPSWFIGCWGKLHFYTLKSGKWKNVGNIKRNICREESYMNCIKKMKGKKIQVMEEIWVDGDVVEKPRIIHIK